MLIELKCLFYYKGTQYKELNLVTGFSKMSHTDHLLCDFFCWSLQGKRLKVSEVMVSVRCKHGINNYYAALIIFLNRSFFYYKNKQNNGKV